MGMTVYCEGQRSINSTLVESWDMDTDCLGSFLSSFANDLCNLGKFLKPSAPLFPNGIHLIGMRELNLVMCIKYLEVQEVPLLCRLLPSSVSLHTNIL